MAIARACRTNSAWQRRSLPWERAATVLPKTFPLLALHLFSHQDACAFRARVPPVSRSSSIVTFRSSNARPSPPPPQGRHHNATFATRCAFARCASGSLSDRYLHRQIDRKKMILGRPTELVTDKFAWICLSDLSWMANDWLTAWIGRCFTFSPNIMGSHNVRSCWMYLHVVNRGLKRLIKTETYSQN